MMGVNSRDWSLRAQQNDLPATSTTYPNDVLFAVGEGEHEEHDYTSFCGARPCSLRMTVDMPYECTFPGCRYVGTRALADRHESGHGLGCVMH